MTSHIAGKSNVSFVQARFTLSTPLPVSRIYSGFLIVVELVTVMELPEESNVGLPSKQYTNGICTILPGENQLTRVVTSTHPPGEVLFPDPWTVRCSISLIRTWLPFAM
ncbi:MAG: hypothetical protein WAM19_08280 [Nitrososphaeraceae archaeon]